MNFFKKLFGNAEKNKPTSSKESVPGAITGDKLGQHIMQLEKQALKEGWDPTASISISCNDCDCITKIMHSPSFLGGGLCFVYDGNMRTIDKPFSCLKCNGNSFTVETIIKSFKDTLREGIDRRPPCTQDPSQGFVCDETGALISDHAFNSQPDFESLWSTISRDMDQQASVNDSFSFDYITDSNRQTRYIQRISGICHFNSKKNKIIVIFKDTSGRYWHMAQFR